MSAPRKEGWDVPTRPPLIGLILFVATLVLFVTVAGRIYVHRIAPGTRPPGADFPEPRLELTQTPPGLARHDYQQPPPAGINRAMAETAARGAAIWAGTGA